MKKLLLKMVTFALAITLTFSVAGCNNINYLSFNSNFSGNTAGTGDSAGVSEVLKYSVNLVDNYNEQIKKDKTLTDDVVKYEFTNGKYVQTLSILPFLPDEIKAITDIEGVGNIYRLKTEFSIDVLYTFNDNSEPYAHTDTIYTDCYFLAAGQSFAPLWSNVKVDNTYLSISMTSNRAITVSGIYEYTTEYKQKSYIVKSTSIEDDKETKSEKTYEYNYKTTIDNAQLLFAMRNLNVEEKANVIIPVVSPSYGTAKSLQISYTDSSTYRKTISYNDGSNTTSASEIPVKNFNFMISATENTGALHYMKYQKDSVEGLPFRSLLVEYAAPVISFSSYSCLGAMVYQLDSVTVMNINA